MLLSGMLNVCCKRLTVLAMHQPQELGLCEPSQGAGRPTPTRSILKEMSMDSNGLSCDDPSACLSADNKGCKRTFDAADILQVLHIENLLMQHAASHAVACMSLFFQCSWCLSMLRKDCTSDFCRYVGCPDQCHCPSVWYDLPCSSVACRRLLLPSTFLQLVSALSVLLIPHQLY